ncbi:MAG: GNAT family N-acetyltransferase [Gammaproteobacteria bacterium]|nr:GNAT family N-acetyltransferase [Gammaproteobacteria bacterium]
MKLDNKYLVREASANDLKDIVRLLFELKRQYASCKETTLEEFSKHYISSISEAIINDSNIIYVTAHNDHIIAFLSGTTRLTIRTNGITAVMEEIYVDSSHRRKGVGKCMWNHFTRHLLDNNIHYVEVVTSMAHPGQREFANSIGLEWYSSIHRATI